MAVLGVAKMAWGKVVLDLRVDVNDRFVCFMMVMG